MVWGEDGRIVTASHVVGEGTGVTATLSDGRELEARVVGRDMYTDVALLKVDAHGLAPIARGETGEPRVGNFVMALANAFGPRASATSGMVTSVGRSVRGWRGALIEGAVVSDAQLNPGYSGGPLVDAGGKLLGMNVAHFAGRAIAIPAATVEQVVDALANHGKVKRGFLGVAVEPIGLPDELAGSPGVGQDAGLLVVSVSDDSPAKAGGVAIGDVILRLGDAKALNERELHKTLSGAVVGKRTSLWVLRGERPTELHVEPAEA
jgi:S1-C subfamily serine protease